MTAAPESAPFDGVRTTIAPSVRAELDDDRWRIKIVIHHEADGITIDVPLGEKPQELTTFLDCLASGKRPPKRRRAYSIGDEGLVIMQRMLADAQYRDQLMRAISSAVCLLQQSSRVSRKIEFLTWWAPPRLPT